MPSQDFYRPSEIPAPSGGGISAAGSGTPEIPQGGLNSGFQGQMVNRADIASAQQFFSARPGNPGLMTGALRPGAESVALAAKCLPPLPGAEQISPMIQMIMRLPGHLGLMTSFFELLGHIFAPATELLGHLDLSMLAIHAQEAAHAFGSMASEHMSIDISMLPADAPILQTLGHAGKALGEHATGLSRDSLNVSGTLDLGKPQFEQGISSMPSKLASGKELISGPSMSDTVPGNSLAGNHRFFADQLATPGSGNNLLTATGNATSTTAGSTASNSLNVNGCPFGQEGGTLPASAQIQDGLLSGTNLSQNVGAHLGSIGHPSIDSANSLGPSGAVSDHLGGQRLLASNSTANSTAEMDRLGSASDSISSATGSQFAPQSSSGVNQLSGNATGPATVTGLKAQELSLKALKGTTGGAHKVVDQVAHQSRNLSKSAAGHDQIAHHSINKTGSADTPGNKQSPADNSKIADTKPVSRDIKSDPAGKEVPTAKSNSDISKISDAGASGTPNTYTIRAGDCLWNIAKDHLGSATKWTEIYKLNSNVLGANPSLIRPGTTINLPGQGAEVASTSAGKYLVHSGDNLWNIARDHLGGGQHWGEIYKMNGDVIGANPGLIHPGQQLSLASDSGQIAAATPAATPLANAALPQPSVAAAAHSSAGATEAAGTAMSHPVTPSNLSEVSMMPPSGAAEAATQVTTQASVPSSNSIVSPSLAPDLSFLYRKPSR